MLSYYSCCIVYILNNCLVPQRRRKLLLKGVGGMGSDYNIFPNLIYRLTHPASSYYDGFCFV